MCWVWVTLWVEVGPTQPAGPQWVKGCSGLGCDLQCQHKLLQYSLANDSRVTEAELDQQS